MRLPRLLYFGAAVMDIFRALLNGAAIFPFDIRRERLTLLAGCMQRERITIYHSTPTVFRHFIGTLTGEQQFPALRLIDLGGELVTKQDFELYRRHFGRHSLLVNGLGSTELNVSLQYFMNGESRSHGQSCPSAIQSRTRRSYCWVKWGRTRDCIGREKW